MPERNANWSVCKLPARNESNHSKSRLPSPDQQRSPLPPLRWDSRFCLSPQPWIEYNRVSTWRLI